jgi:hypothetical protein
MSAGIDQPKPFQMKQIIAQRSVSRRGIDLCADIGKLTFSPTSDGLKNLALAFSKIMRNAKRSYIPARQEPNAYRSGDLQELRFWMAGPQTQLNNLLRATPPALNQSSPVKDLRDQRILRSRQLLPLQILDLHAERKFPGTPYLKAIIVDCHARCSACLGVIPVTERIDQCFAQRYRRKERLIDTLEQTWFDAARDR